MICRFFPTQYYLNFSDINTIKYLFIDQKYLFLAADFLKRQPLSLWTFTMHLQATHERGHGFKHSAKSLLQHIAAFVPVMKESTLIN